MADKPTKLEKLHDRSNALDVAASLLDDYPLKGKTILEISNIRTAARACRKESAALLRRARNISKRTLALGAKE